MSRSKGEVENSLRQFFISNLRLENFRSMFEDWAKRDDEASVDIEINNSVQEMSSKFSQNITVHRTSKGVSRSNPKNMKQDITQIARTVCTHECYNYLHKVKVDLGLAEPKSRTSGRLRAKASITQLTSSPDRSRPPQQDLTQDGAQLGAAAESQGAMSPENLALLMGRIARLESNGDNSQSKPLSVSDLAQIDDPSTAAAHDEPKVTRSTKKSKKTKVIPPKQKTRALQSKAETEPQKDVEIHPLDVESASAALPYPSGAANHESVSSKNLSGNEHEELSEKPSSTVESASVVSQASSSSELATQ